MVSNRKFLIKVFPSFYKWYLNNDCLWTDFDQIKETLEVILFQKIMTDNENCKLIASRIAPVYENCDDLNYDQLGVVEAYVIMHFLERYHRFQHTFLFLLQMGVLPIRKLCTDVLDIGAGPTPALYALADLILRLKQYGIENNIDRLTSIDFNVDYVEKSKNFRSWLRFFSRSNSTLIFKKTGLSKPYPYSILPLDNGLFIDFNGLNLQNEKMALRNSLIEDVLDDTYSAAQDYIRGTLRDLPECNPELREELIKQVYETADREFIYSEDMARFEVEQSDWRYSHKYNLVLFSYFLTQEDQIEARVKELCSITSALRNGGTIVIVGARGGGGSSTKAYSTIYKRITEILQTAKCKHVCSCKMGFKYNLGYSSRGIPFYKNIINCFNETNTYNLIPDHIRTRLNRRAELSNTSSIWEVHVYRKGRWPHTFRNLFLTYQDGNIKRFCSHGPFVDNITVQSSGSIVLQFT